jgi:hypothetical protein
MSTLAQLLAGVGGLLVGVVAVGSLILAVRARREAAEARRESPAAMLEGLRIQVQAVIDAHQEAVRRHQMERDGIEDSLQRERARADGAELVAMRLQGQVAVMKIDLANARADLSELRARFDASIGNSNS